MKGKWASNLIPKDLEQATRVLKERLRNGLSILPESPSELNTTKNTKPGFRSKSLQTSAPCRLKGNWAINLIQKDLEQATRVLKERLRNGLPILPESPSKLNATER